MESVQDVEMIATTEKDAVKIEGNGGRGYTFLLSIEAQIENEDALIAQICSKVRDMR